MFNINRKFSFIKHRKLFYIISLAVIILGIGVGFIRGFNFGIDFTGGTSCISIWAVKCRCRNLEIF
jgi:SecD/SecF fusion protein